MACCNRSMQVPAFGSGDILRLLEAMLPLPELERVPPEHQAVPAPVRDDEAILQYASVLHLVQSVENPSAATPALVSQKPDIVAQVVAPTPQLEQALLQMPIAHAVSHTSYAINHQPAAQVQALIDVPAYMPPVLQREDDRLCGIEPARRGRVPVWGQIVRSGARKLWLRAPLLALLVAWLVAGLVAAAFVPLPTVFDAWALGFLALVGLGFYARVRSVRL